MSPVNMPRFIFIGGSQRKLQCTWLPVFIFAMWTCSQSSPASQVQAGRHTLGDTHDAVPTANTSSRAGIHHELRNHFKSTQQLCQHYGFSERPPSERTPLIFDFFLASQEKDMMEIRLRELEHVVDIFVPVESRMTFTGHWKPLMFPTLYKDLPGYVIGKIRYLVLDSLTGDGAWAREHHHRGALLQLGLKSPGISPREGDILLISDADEIPKPMFLYALKHCSGAIYPHSMQTMLHYYSFNRYARFLRWFWYNQHYSIAATHTIPNYHIAAKTHTCFHPRPSDRRLREGKQGSSWEQPKVMLYTAAGPNDAPALRGARGLHVYKNTSWHCSSCFNTISAVVTKLRSFSHTEADTDANRDPSTIVERVRSGNDLMGRLELWGPEPFEKVTADQLDLPQFITEHPTRFSYLISRDSADAGFLDLDLHIGHHDEKSEDGIINTTDSQQYPSKK